MRTLSLLLPLCLVAVATAAPSPVVLPLGKAYRAVADVSDDDPVGGDIWPVAIFWMMISVGTPPQLYPVAIDTGSDTLDIPHVKCSTCVSAAPNRFYNPANSSTSKAVPCNWSCGCSNGQCSFSNSYQTCDLSNPSAVCTIEGLLYEDMVSIAPATHAVQARFGTITSQTSNFDQFQNIDGVVGLAGNNNQDIGNVFGTLFAQGALPKDEFGMCFVEGSKSNGTMTVGGLDDRLYTGPFQLTPNAGAAQGFYGLRLAGNGISVGGGSSGTIEGTANALAILDSGTNVLLLPSGMYSSFSSLLSANSSLPDVEALLDGKCLPMTEAQIDEFPDITFQLTNADSSGAPFELTMPPRTYLLLGEKKTGYCLGVRNTGPGGNFIVGDTTMEDYFVAFDRTAGTIGFAPVNRKTCGSL